MSLLVRVITPPQRPSLRTINALDVLHQVGGNASILHSIDLNSSVRLLRQMRIRVSETYYDGSGWIHAGKVGHWAMMVSFWSLVAQQRAIGVWFEDDVRFVAHTWQRLVHFASSHAVARGLVWRASRYDACLIVSPSAAHTLLGRVRRDGIDNPTDLWMSARGLARPAPFRFQTHRFPSTITRTPVLRIRDVNAGLV